MRWPIAAACSLALVLAAPASAQSSSSSSSPRLRETAQPEQITFESGSAVLTPESGPALDAAAARFRAALASGQAVRVRVEGHTDGSGSAETNLALSQARAEAVAAALSTRGLPASTLLAVGFGSVRPLESEASAAGRRRNRRVEFHLLSREQDNERVATVARTLNRVERRAPQTDAWSQAAVRDPLFEAWRLAAQARSAADVAFTTDSAQLHVRENTVVVIFGPGELVTSSFGGRMSGKARLERGALKSKLAALAGQGELQVSTDAAQADVAGADVLVTVDGQKRTRVAHHGGRAAEVRAQKPGAAPLSLAAGFGTAVDVGGEPTPPQPLPPAPAALTPAAGDGVFEIGAEGVGRVAASWQPRLELQGYHVELFKDGEELVDVVDVPAATAAFEAQGLPPGTYQLAVSAVDQAGFEGIPSTPLSMKVVVAQAPPPKAPEPPPPPAPSPAPPREVTPTVHPLWGALPLAYGLGAGFVALGLALDGVQREGDAPLGIALLGSGVAAGLLGVALLVQPVPDAAPATAPPTPPAPP